MLYNNGTNNYFVRMSVSDHLVFYMLFVFILELVQVLSTMNNRTIEYCKFRSSGILNYYMICYVNSNILSTDFNIIIVTTTVILVETAAKKTET